MRYFQMVGRQTESENMLKLAEDFLKNPEKNKFLMLRGGYGVGKSLFLRVLLNKIVMMLFIINSIICRNWMSRNILKRKIA